jgi:hypothetical protein
VTSPATPTDNTPESAPVPADEIIKLYLAYILSRCTYTVEQNPDGTYTHQWEAKRV